MHMEYNLISSHKLVFTHLSDNVEGVHVHVGNGVMLKCTQPARSLGPMGKVVVLSCPTLSKGSTPPLHSYTF